MKKSKKMTVVLLAMLLCVSLTACGSSMESAFDSISNNASGAVGGDLFYDDDYKTENSWEESEWEDGSSDAGESVSSNRKLIKTVDLTAETYEFDELVSTVEKRVAELGGYMENASIHSRYDDLHYGDFVIRIPVNKMDKFVTEFAELSNITDKDTSQEDVTLTYVDLESHKAALEAEEKSLLNLLENAASIDDIIALQSRLTDVRYQIESMESQLRTMDNLIEYATINLYIEEVETYTPVEEPTMGERISTGFKSSLDDVITGAQNFIVFILANSPVLIIWAILIAVFALVIRLIVKISIKKMEASEEKRLAEQRKRMQANQANAPQQMSAPQNGTQNGQGNGK